MKNDTKVSELFGGGKHDNQTAGSLIETTEDVIADAGRWLPARLIWRWGALLWIGPLLGLITGLVLVFVFFKKNETVEGNVRVGHIPDIVDANTFLADMRSELESDATFVEVQRNLDQDDGFLKTPLWWIRSRIVLDQKEVPKKHNDYMNVFYTHHNYEGCEDLSTAFQEAAKVVVPRVREKYIEGWLKQIDARLGEIDAAYKVAEVEKKLRDFPYFDEKYDLENDRETLLIDDEHLGKEISLPGSFGGYPPWWKSPPEWAIYICKCTGYGLLAVFPAILILEKLRPRRPTRKKFLTTESPHVS
jgi:hypothetical protein